MSMDILSALLMMLSGLLPPSGDSSKSPAQDSAFPLLLSMIAGQPSDSPSIAPAQSTHPQWGKSINKYAQQYDIDPRFAEAVMHAESGGNPHAVSRAGAVGLMQLMPATFRLLGGKNPSDPEENLAKGIQYIRQLSDQVGNDPRLVAAAYNWGPGNVKQFKGQPYEEWQHKLPSETRLHGQRIAEYMQKGR